MKMNIKKDIEHKVKHKQTKEERDSQINILCNKLVMSRMNQYFFS